MAEIKGSGGSNKDSGICGLCFISCTANSEAIFADIREYKGILMDIFAAEIKKDDSFLNQKICVSCKEQIEATNILRIRIKFSIPFWVKYQNHRFIQNDTAQGQDPPIHKGLVLNCHECGIGFNYKDLLSHIVSDHGTDHVPDCQFCKVLLETSTRQNVNENELRLDKSDPISDVNCESTHKGEELHSDSTEKEDKEENNLDFSDDDEDLKHDPDPNDKEEDSGEEEEKANKNTASSSRKTNARLHCDMCDKSYINIDTLRTHKRKFHDIETLVCRINSCLKSFPTEEALAKHRRKVHKQGYRCPVCREVFAGKKKLQEHVTKDHPRITCFECHVEFPSLKGLKLHARVHEEAMIPVAGDVIEKADSKPFACTKCEASFRSQNRLDIHWLDRHDEKGYPCDQCPKVFESRSKMKQHVYLHKKKLCGICGIYVSNSMNTHMRKHDNYRPFKCLVEGCGKQFPRNYNLTKHSQTHTGTKPYSCRVCGVSFTQNSGLTIHSRRHTGEKPFKCSFPDCPKLFAHKFALQLHLRRHTGEKTFECDRCGEGFYVTSNLKRHKIKCQGAGVVAVADGVKEDGKG